MRDLARATPARQAGLARTLAPYGATIKAIAAGGGTIIAGTDSPIFPYGLSLHVELQAYVDAGLTPFQALRDGDGQRRAARSVSTIDWARSSRAGSPTSSSSAAIRLATSARRWT